MEKGVIIQNINDVFAIIRVRTVNNIWLNTSVDRIENILLLVRSVYIPLYSNGNV